MSNNGMYLEKCELHFQELLSTHFNQAERHVFGELNHLVIFKLYYI